MPRSRLPHRQRSEVVWLHHLAGMLVVDFALIVDPIDVDAELAVALAVLALDVARDRFAYDHVTGRGAERPRQLVFEKRVEPLLGMRMHFLRCEYPAPEDRLAILRVERR